MLTPLLIILLLFSVVVIGAPNYGNVGPTTEFGFDIKIEDEIVCEGSTADEFETTFTITDPTADRTYTFPDSDQTYDLSLYYLKTEMDSFSELQAIISDKTLVNTENKLSDFAATTSAELAGVISDETGSGLLVYGTSPNITTPTGIVKGDVGLGNVENLKVKLDGTSAPGVSNDDTEGYAVGSRWIDATNDKEYVALDVSTGAAVWTETTGAGNGGYTNLTQFINQTAWRLFYSNADGDVTELALGTDGQYLKSTGATSAPIFDTPAGTGTVTTSGTPEVNDIARFTGATVIEGLTYDELTTALALTSDDLTDVAFIAMLDENEDITGAWTVSTGSIAGVDATEFGYLDGVASDIQTQFGLRYLKTEMDSFSELQAIIADKTLVNVEDGITATSITDDLIVKADFADEDWGDMTVTTNVVTIDSGAVTYAKIQNISATDKILGRSSVGAGLIEEIVCTSAGRALIDDVDASAQRTTLGIDLSLYYLKTEIDTLSEVETIYTKDIIDSTELATALTDYYLKTAIDSQVEVETIWGVSLVNDGDLDLYYLKTAIDSQSEVETIWGVTLATDTELAALKFTDLTDTPANYTGQAGKYVKVNAGETDLEFGTPAGGGTYLELTDTPVAYDNGKYAKSTADGVVWEDPAGAGDMTKAVYDTDTDSIADKAETVDDGVGNSSTAADVKDAVTKKHSQNTDTDLDATFEATFAKKADKLDVFAATTEAELYTVLSDVSLFLEELKDDTTPEYGGAMDHNNQRDTEVKTVEFNALYDNGNSGAAPTINWQNGNYQKIAVSENTLFTFSNAFIGTITLQITFSGAFTAGFNAGYTILEEGGTEISFTETLNAVDILKVMYLGTANNYIVGLMADVKD